ncbi:MAG: multicopper oxidase family protein [Candidatus Kaiserbacteria bacterium]|nr:MAG: multicopper oxidase family protein [Candidatus Kaiserbacteria bacterium]
MSKQYFYIAVAVALLGGGFAAFSYLPSLSTPRSEVSQIVELQDGDSYDLTAGFVQKEIDGKTYRLLAYNGSIPGPLLKIPQGAEVTINFKNGTDMKTLLHSHGVRMENAFDGSQTTQEEMEPGESFAYTLKFPDAGFFWYHPHVREDYQQELGLYGGYLVVPSEEGYWSPVNREIPIFLDDILIENGKINLNKEGADKTLMGRFGNVMLVNGETDYSLNVKKGEVIRLYVTNSANTRTFNFAIEGARMKLVGADSGAYEKDTWIDSVILGPSERGIVEVQFQGAGTYVVQNKTPERTYALGSVRVAEEAVEESYAASFANLATHAQTIASIDPFRAYFDDPPQKRLALTVDMNMGSMNMQGMSMMDGSTSLTTNGIEWEEGESAMMNAMSGGSVRWNIVDQESGKKNMDIDWAFARGEPVKIRIFNDPTQAHPMQHPIHFHGQRFLIVNKNGQPNDNLVWKDTVLIPAGQYVDILLDTSNPGTWMAHCHIAEHLEAGMMMKFTVE